MNSERDDSLASSVWRLGRFALGARVQEEEGIHLAGTRMVITGTILGGSSAVGNLWVISYGW